MKAISLVLGVILAIGLAAAYVVNKPHPAVVDAAGADGYFDQTAAIEDRILALEQAVAEERNARQLLEEELQAVYAELDALSERPGLADEPDEAAVTVVPQVRNRFSRGRFAPDSADGRIDDLVEGGLPQDRAEWIVKRETELELAAMQARFEARNSGERVNFSDPAYNPAAALRAEIGDAEYEQYLEASGRATMVGVDSVMELSPGAVAGLQPGDQIVSYDGQRVFNTAELNRLTMRGTPGDTIVIDILRDGAPMQLTLPSGPIGIYTRGGGRRR